MPCNIPLASKLAFLEQAASYGNGPGPVQAIETHMSWVFLSGEYAWKLKKPVAFGPFDACALDARRHYCEEEIRLNRRLAPQVYLATVPLVQDADGHLRIGERGGDHGVGGEVVEWLVKMRRLRPEAMLDTALQSGTATLGDMHGLARLLARFHAGCTRAALAPLEHPAKLAASVAENRRELGRPCFGLPAQRIACLCDAQQSLLRDATTLLQERVQQGRVVDGHGDLRAEHVYLGDPPAIIDCIEFSPQLRAVDGLDEAGFLALECERFGRADLGSAFLSSYLAAAKDTPPSGLTNLYQSLRASVRARITIVHLLEERFQQSPLWRTRTLNYLQLAEQHLAAAAR